MRARARLAPGRLWLSDRAFDAMAAESGRMSPLESGGVLLGWQDPGGVEVVVARVLGPGPAASHKRTRFSPDSDWQLAEIARAYEQSGRVLSYLGDWHSHPGGDERPSRQDERTARKIARFGAARTRTPVMLILAVGDEEWRAAPHRYLRKRLHRMELVIAPAASAIAPATA